MSIQNSSVNSSLDHNTKSQHRLLSRIFKMFNMKLDSLVDGTIQITHDQFTINGNSKLPAIIWRALLSKNPDLVIGQSYMDGDWVVTSGNLVDVLKVLTEIMEDKLIVSKILKPIQFCIFTFRQFNTPKLSRNNIAAHYDTGTEFFSFLGETMSYSSAIFDTEKSSLLESQKKKTNIILDLMNIHENCNILDVGCGWGLMTKSIQENYKNVHVTGITHSVDQLEWAKKNDTKKSINYLLCDYRNLGIEHNKKYDRIVSLEMFDHVGKLQHTTYFKQLASLLKDDGNITLQLITRPRKGLTTTWVNNYIYPGGYIASLEEIETAYKKAGLRASKKIAIDGYHYARTLEEWQKNFTKNWPIISEKNKYGEEIFKMWEFFFAASIACFKYSKFGNLHLQLVK